MFVPRDFAIAGLPFARYRCIALYCRGFLPFFVIGLSHPSPSPQPLVLATCLDLLPEVVVRSHACIAVVALEGFVRGCDSWMSTIVRKACLSIRRSCARRENTKCAGAKEIIGCMESLGTRGPKGAFRLSVETFIETDVDVLERNVQVGELLSYLQVRLEFGEGQILNFVKEHTNAQAQLAGNSIHVDFLFLKKYMPRLAEHMHYRLVDVTTVVELARRWYPSVHRRAPKKKVHSPLPPLASRPPAWVSTTHGVGNAECGTKVKTMLIMWGLESRDDVVRLCGVVVQ